MSSFKRARTMSFSGSQGFSQSTATLGAAGGPRMPRKVAGFATKRPVVKRGKLTVSSVRAIVKESIKASQEVKTIDFAAVAQNVGQINMDVSGHSSIEVDITPSQGTNARQRIGDAILLDKMVINVQALGQASTGSAVNLTHFLVSFRGSGPTVVIADLFDGNIALDDQNAGAQIYDVGVLRNPSYEGPIKIVATWKTRLPANENLQAGTPTPHGTSQTIVDLKGQRMEYDGLSGDNANIIYAVITVADSGNRSATLSTLNGVVTRTALTGAAFSMGIRTFFRDA